MLFVFLQMRNLRRRKKNFKKEHSSKKENEVKNPDTRACMTCVLGKQRAAVAGRQ